jgi:hypothetical protein
VFFVLITAELCCIKEKPKFGIRLAGPVSELPPMHIVRVSGTPPFSLVFKLP